jgi:nitrous oxidase accessory protein
MLNMTLASTDLQQQLDQAEAGATLLLTAGVYQGNFIINKPVTLKGVEGGKDVILDGNKHGHVVTINAPNVTLQNLTIQHSGHNLTNLDAGVFVARSANNVTIKDNHFYFNAFGMWLDLAENAKIMRNRIQGNPAIRSQDRGNGIHLFSVKNALVEGNEIWQTRDAIYIDTSNHNVLKNNTMYDLRYGIHYMYSYHNKVLNNYSHHTRSGYALMQSKYLTVMGNRSEDDDNYGILMNFITHSTIKNNTVTRVKRGGSVGLGVGGLDAEGKAVFIYNSLYNTITHNIFQDSSIGIHLTAGSEDNIIHHNAFIHNHTQVKYVANRQQEWSLAKQGNYWSDYLGWDRDDNGVGDQAYIPNDNIDKLLWKYPLAKVLMHSPAIETLHVVQQQFPLLRSVGIRDSFPLMQIKQE